MKERLNVVVIEPLTNGKVLVGVIDLPVRSVCTLVRLEGSFSPLGYFFLKWPKRVRLLGRFEAWPSFGRLHKLLACYSLQGSLLLAFGQPGRRFAAAAGRLPVSEP